MSQENIGLTNIQIGVESTIAQDLQPVNKTLNDFAQKTQEVAQRAAKAMQGIADANEELSDSADELSKQNQKLILSETRKYEAINFSKSAQLENKVITAGSLAEQKKLEAALRPIINSYKQLEQAQKSQTLATKVAEDPVIKFRQELERMAQTAGKTQKELAELRAQQLGHAESLQPLINKAYDTGDAFKSVAMSAGQTRQAMRLLPAQITDVVTSLASGMPIYLIAIQQGGQLRDSFGGFGNMMKGIVALINPFVVVMTALVAVAGAAYYVYDRLQGVLNSFEQALIKSGNASGKTSEEMFLLSQSISSVVGTQKDAAEALNLIIGNNKLIGQSYEDIAEASVKWSRATGSSVEEVVNEFAKIAKDPVSALKELDDKYNFLTASAYENVRALLDQGNQTEASRVMIEALSATIDERAPMMVENMSNLSKVVKNLKDFFNDAAEGAANLFFNVSLSEQYKEIATELSNLIVLQQELNSMYTGNAVTDQQLFNDARIFALEAELKAASDLLDARKKSADQDSENFQQKKDFVAIQEFINKGLSAEAILTAQMIELNLKYTEAIKAENITKIQRLQIDTSYYKQAKEFADKYVSSFEKIVTSSTKVQKSTRDVNAEILKQIEAYKLEGEALLMSAKQRDIATFALDLQNKKIIEGSVAWNQYMEAFTNAANIKETNKDFIEAMKERQKALLKQEQDQQKEIENIQNQIGQSLTDALMNGGKNAGEMLKDLFKTLILRPLLQPIIAGVTGGLGFGGTAGASGIEGLAGAVGGGGGMDFMGLASTLKDGYTMLSTGFAAVGVAASEMAASFAYGTGMMTQQTAMLAAQEAGMSTMVGSVGAAATVLAGVAAGISAGTFISGQYALGGDQIISTGLGTAIGTGIGFAVGGPIGAAIGAFLGGSAGGLVNRAFGQGPKQTQNAGITGTISAGGTSLSSFTDWKRSGGWFSSGSSGRSMGGVDQGIVDYFNGTLALVSGSVKIMAESIGLSTNEIAGYSEQIQISLLGLTQVQAQEKLQEAINNFTNNLIVKSLPVIKRYQYESESASQTLTRLSQSLATANQIFKAMNMSTLDLTIQAADSASQLIALTGGIDSFLSKMDFVYQNFYSEQERVDNAVENLSDTFKSLGLVVPSTKNQFKELISIVQAAGSNTLLAALLEIAPAFNTVTNATEKLALDAAQIAQKILQERVQLETKISQALGDTASIRQRELESIDESNRGLAMSLYELSDAQDALQISTDQTDKAFANLEKSLQTRLTTTLEKLKTDFDALTKSLDAQIKATTEAEQAAQSNINSLKSVFTYLQEQINDLSGLGKKSYSFAQAMAYLAKAEQAMKARTGIPEQEQLAAAVSGARTSLTNTSIFKTSFDQQKATGLLVAQLTRLKDATANQLSIEEKQLVVMQEQLKSLYASYDKATIQYAADQKAANDLFNKDLKIAQNQIDALRGIDNTVYTVKEAVDKLNVSVLSEKASSVNLQQIMIALLQDSKARADAEAAKKAADKQAAIDKAIADKKALDDAKKRANLQVAQELAAKNKALADKAIADANERARLQAIADAEAKARALREQESADLYNFLWGGFWDDSSANSPDTSISWGGAQNADGGMFQGGISLVGEEGPELVNFARPSMIYTAGETAEILNGNSVASETANEIRQLRQENQAQSRAMVSLQSRMTRLIEQWDGDGLPTERYEGATA